MKKAVQHYKEIRSCTNNAYVYRIASKREHPYAVFEYVKRDRSEFTLFAFGHGIIQPNRYPPLLKMRGLDPDSIYACENKKMSGKALMNIGIKVELKGDY
ncbi:MAG: GH36 C-terminal domain-containing protein, partial [Kiritimatiellae bacterium]|nr:GH36 C-terminal domain-containing protein [Kiritimatiellia bacterium]